MSEDSLNLILSSWPESISLSKNSLVVKARNTTPKNL